MTMFDPRPLSRATSAVAAGVAAVLLAGCSTGGSASSGTTKHTGQSTAPAAVPHDPAARFAAGQGVVIGADTSDDQKRHPDLPVAVQGTRSYLAGPAQVNAVDVVTGKTLWSAGPTPAPATDQQYASPAPPVLATMGGTTVVLAAYPATVPGHGTVAARPAVELLVVNATTGSPAWSTQVEPAAGDSGAEPPPPTVLGVDGTIAVLTAQNSLYAFDLQAKRLLWSKTGFGPLLLIDHRIVGVRPPDEETPQTITALKVTDGTPSWSARPGSYHVSAQAAGQQLIAVTATDYGSGETDFLLLHSDGTPAQKPAKIGTGLVPGEAFCQYDQATVTVCSGKIDGKDWASGLDATTGKELWSLPQASAGRTAPQVTAAWHGIVYGTTNNGPVALDARTGGDRPDSPGIAPLMVNAYTGIVTANGQITAHPTAG